MKKSVQLISKSLKMIRKGSMSSTPQNLPTTSSQKPSLFSQLIGNEPAKRLLKRQLEKEAFPQVALFYGPDGIGKGHFAFEIADHLLGKNKKEHPDLHVVYPDPKSNQHPVASVRAIIEEAALPPFEAPCKVFIIHDVEKMAPTSSNTLLKTLEEPAPDTRFILLSSQIDQVLPTIVSRCHKIPFFAVSEEELGDFIMHKFHTQEGKKIALLSQGSVAKAVQRATQPIDFPVDPLFRSLSYQELHTHLSQLQEPPEEGFYEETDRLFEEILYWVREHDPLRLEEALPLISQSQYALKHHIKFKNVLEHFYLSYLKL